MLVGGGCWREGTGRKGKGKRDREEGRGVVVIEGGSKGNTRRLGWGALLYMERKGKKRGIGGRIRSSSY